MFALLSWQIVEFRHSKRQNSAENGKQSVLILRFPLPTLSYLVFKNSIQLTPVHFKPYSIHKTNVLFFIIFFTKFMLYPHIAEWKRGDANGTWEPGFGTLCPPLPRVPLRHD